MDREIQNNEVTDKKSTLTDLKGKKFKALVVEDDRSQWPLWESILNSLERTVEVDWATKAEEAQELLRQSFQMNNTYDLVISDVFLEGAGTGVDVWNRYGEAAQNFVFVSGEDLAGSEISKKLQFGNPLFIKKPISPANCKTILKLMCDNNKGVL